MTLLTVWKETDPSAPVLETTDEGEIRAALAELGARFSRWDVHEIASDAALDDVLALYAEQVEKVKQDEGYTLVDIVGLSPAQENTTRSRSPRASASCRSTATTTTRTASSPRVPASSTCT